MAIVGEGSGGRAYVSATTEHERFADCPEPPGCPESRLPDQALGFRVQLYGLDQHKKLYTNRQLTALTTFTTLVQEAQRQAEADALAAGMSDGGKGLAEGGDGAKAYGEAVGVYLAFAVDKCANRNSNLCAWKTGVQCPGDVFARQAISMVWDYAEANIFGPSGSFESMHTNVIAGLLATDYSKCISGIAYQQESQKSNELSNIAISTDPPYYDNIGYADLSDFFYVWMRQSLNHIYPNLFRTMMVPKNAELVAAPSRFGGSARKAKEFFVSGMIQACQQMYFATLQDIPVTIYYAYKQSDSEADDAQAASTGWETMLAAIIEAGFAITGTWPMRTERENRKRAQGSNALASSIVLVCRKRPETAPVCTRRNFINALKRELRPALQKLQSSNIAPVDLAQSAIGPGMGVYSQYSQVLEADGTPMSVRSALKVINQEIDLYFDGQDNDLDSESRFCVNLYSQVAFNEIKFGDANTLATAKNTSVATMVSHGTLYAQGGIAHLIERPELPESINEHEGGIWLLCQQLAYKMEKEGVEGCAKAVANMIGSNAERAKDLAYRLYTIAERKKWAPEAYAYNALVVAWPEIQSRAAELQAIRPEQMELF